MTNDNWSLVDFYTNSEDLEVVSDLLWMLGVVAIEELATQSELVVLRTSMGDDPTSAIHQVTQRFPLVTAKIIQMPREVADTWRAHAVATPVNKDVSLVPAWVTPPENGDYVLIEPLDTFGLGNHPTTVLALQLALAHIPRESSVFDFGCGSGVLAVAMVKLKACAATVFDIAENAQQAVKINCEINQIDLIQWDSNFTNTTSDAVLANILAPVLTEFSKDIQEAVVDEGLVVLSGMRTEQVEKVISHYSECEEFDRATIDGWTAVILRKVT